MSAAKIALITTGGTISSRRNERAGPVPALGGAELLSELKGAAGEITPEVIEFAKIPGCEMTPAMMAALAELVERTLLDDAIAGAVVTHGTDTIEESAFFCHLTVASFKPVVFTGSMRTASELSWDGPRNLLDAMRVAAWPRARGMGTLLVMNEEIHSARFVTKRNGAALGALGSPACGPLGRIHMERPMLFARPALERRVFAPRIVENVAVVRALSGERSALDQALLSTGLAGLVIDGFGAGRVPFAWIEPLETAAARGLPLVLCSRTGAGWIDDPYGYRGAHYLRSIGLIAAHELPAHKARLKLMVGLGNRLSRGAIREYFELE